MNWEQNHKTFSQREKIGQCFHPAAFIHDTPEGIAQIEQLITDYKIGGLTFFYSRESVETNFNRKKGFGQKGESIEKLFGLINHYQKLSETPLLISIDAEWGLGMRIASHPPFPYPLTLSATGDPTFSFEVGKAIGQELKAMGIHLNLAPVVDINTNPKNPVIGYRSFGMDAATVFAHARAYYAGLKSEGILGCLKHFPGHGDTQTDSHLALPVIDKPKEALQANELLPFKHMIDEGVDCVMTGHIHIPTLDARPASLSRKIIQGVLREELGFEGVVISDALNMKSVCYAENKGELELTAFMAGNDMLSFSKHISEALPLIAEKGAETRIEGSFARIMALKAQAGISTGITPAYILPDTITLRQTIAEKAITAIKSVPQTPQMSAVVLVNKALSDTRFKLDYPCEYHELATTGMETLRAENTPLLLAVYPPSYKPPQNFGLTDTLLSDLHGLAEQRPTSLCFFGNPYALSLFEVVKFETLILAYQGLPEYEQAAAKYFSHELEPSGQLPISSL